MTAQHVEVEERSDRQGDFDRFYRAYHDQLLRYSRARFRGLDADEIASETMARAFEQFSLLDRQRSLWPWLTVVARHVAVDFARGRVVCAPVADEAFKEMPDGRGRCPEQEAIGAERSRLVSLTLQRLSDADRRLMRLRLFDDMSHEEIATLLGSTTDAVRQQFHRARARFLSGFSALGGELRGLLPLPILIRLGQRWRRSTKHAAVAAPAALQLASAVAMLAVTPLGGSIAPFASEGASAGRAGVMSTRGMTPQAFGEPTLVSRAAAVVLIDTRSHRGADHPALVDVQVRRGPVTAAATVSRKPFAPGKSDEHQIAVVTPIGTYYLSGGGSNEGPPRVICEVPVVDCT